jgi:hypothetical protein
MNSQTASLTKTMSHPLGEANQARADPGAG